MDNIMIDFANRPETAALVSPDKLPNNIGEAFFEEGAGDEKAEMMILEEIEDDDDSSEGTRSKTNGLRKSEAMESDSEEQTGRESKLKKKIKGGT
jgi:hypothetical protein